MKKKSLALITLNLNKKSDSKTTENSMASISTRSVSGGWAVFGRIEDAARQRQHTVYY